MTEGFYELWQALLCVNSCLLRLWALLLNFFVVKMISDVAKKDKKAVSRGWLLCDDSRRCEKSVQSVNFS